MGFYTNMVMSDLVHVIKQYC